MPQTFFPQEEPEPVAAAAGQVADVTERAALSLSPLTRPVSVSADVFDELIAWNKRFEKLPKRRWRERVKMVANLPDLANSEEHRKAVFARLCQIAKNKFTQFVKRASNVGNRAFRMAATASFLLTIWFLFSESSMMHIYALDFLPSMLVILTPLMIPLSLTFEIAKANNTTKVRRAAIEALGKLAAPESAAIIATAYFDRWVTVQRSAARALEAVLPALTTAHYGQTQAETTPALCRVLEQTAFRANGVSEALPLALVEALGRAGDGRALAMVARVASEAQWGHVREAAERVLPVLRERQRQETDSGTLLRGSAPNAGASDTLLRPAGSSSDTTAPEQLLRASVSDSRADGAD